MRDETASSDYSPCGSSKRDRFITFSARLDTKRVAKEWFIYGFLFWAAFLAVLEPDNVARAMKAGYRLTFDHEVIRITAAALVGAAVTPFVVFMTDRLPIRGPLRWRHAALHSAAAVGLSFCLIVVACVLAAWGFERQWLPSLVRMRDALASNWALLVFALAFLTAIAHARRASPVASDAAAAPLSSGLPDRVPVKSRGRTSFVMLSSIDWIETRGNYVVLHVGTQQHLIRDTLTKFEAQLDAAHFVRIHRQTLVAIAKIRDIRSAGNGDATLRMIDGVELRISRRYRKSVREKWAHGTRP